MARRFRLFLIPLALFISLLLSRLLGGKSFSLETLYFVLGGMAVLALLGVAFGIWSARSTEKKRKAKDDFWLNH